jgi:hypothetical protein
MKTKKRISVMLTSLLTMVLFFTATTVNAQAKSDPAKMKDCGKMKDCCMMKDGKMMQMKDGKMMPMDKDMTMKNGAQCMVNGECTMKDGKKMMMKDGDCMDMNGMMGTCDMMKKDSKCCSEKSKATTYTCSMHPEVKSDKPGKCSKCGMEMIEKK